MQHPVQTLIINHYLFIVVGNGKSSKMMPTDGLISDQNAPKCIWRPSSAGPAGGVHTLWDSLDPLVGFEGPTSKGKEGECAQFCIHIWGIEAPGRCIDLQLSPDVLWIFIFLQIIFSLLTEQCFGVWRLKGNIIRTALCWIVWCEALCCWEARSSGPLAVFISLHNRCLSGG